MTVSEKLQFIFYCTLLNNYFQHTSKVFTNSVCLSVCPYYNLHKYNQIVLKFMYVTGVYHGMFGTENEVCVLIVQLQEHSKEFCYIVIYKEISFAVYINIILYLKY